MNGTFNICTSPNRILTRATILNTVHSPEREESRAQLEVCITTCIGICAREQPAACNTPPLESPKMEYRWEGDPYTDHATEIAPALPCFSGSVIHKGKVVEYIPELEAMEVMQVWAMEMGSINLQTHGLPCQEDRLITPNTCHSSTLYYLNATF